MNLKKSALLPVLVLLFSTAFAQPLGGDEDNGSKFYVKAYGGYGLVNPGSFRLHGTSTRSSPNAIFTSTQAMGSGIRAGGGIGIIASDFLNIGIDADYLNAATIKATSVASESANPEIVLSRLNYNALSITPNLVFKAISKPDYLIYTRIGIILNLPMQAKSSQLDSLVPIGDGGNDWKRVTNGTFKFNLTPGLSAALGAQFRVTDNLRAFGEIFAHFISLLPTQYDGNYVEVSNKVPAGTDFHVSFAKSGPSTGSVTGPPVSGIVSLEDNRFNMNTIGINIGLTYRF